MEVTKDLEVSMIFSTLCVKSHIGYDLSKCCTDMTFYLSYFVFQLISLFLQNVLIFCDHFNLNATNFKLICFKKMSKSMWSYESSKFLVPFDGRVGELHWVLVKLLGRVAVTLICQNKVFSLVNTQNCWSQGLTVVKVSARQAWQPSSHRVQGEFLSWRNSEKALGMKVLKQFKTF